jgi:hypothetical protein
VLLHSYKLFASTTGGTAGVSQLVSSSLNFRSVIQPSSMILTRTSRFGVPPPLEDYLPIEKDLTTCAAEVHFACPVTMDCDGEEVVVKSRETVDHARVWLGW